MATAGRGGRVAEKRHKGEQVVNLWLSEAHHHKFKVYCVQQGVTMQQALRDYVKKLVKEDSK